MYSVFKMLIYAVVAFALVFVLATYIFPVQPETVFQEQVKKELESAKFSEGKLFEIEKALFEQGTINAENLDSENTTTIFNCFNPQICCSLGSETCSQALEVGTKKIIVHERIEAKTAVRCEREQNFFVCDVYIARNPAQVELRIIQKPEKIALEEEQEAKVLYEVLNNGEIDVLNSFTVKAELFKKIGEEEQFVERTEKTIDGLKEGESLADLFSFDLESSGEYVVVIEVGNREIGADSKRAEFTAEGSVPISCKALGQDVAEIYRGTDPLLEELQGKCVRKSYCTQCLLSIDCRNSWQQKGGIFKEASSSHAFQVLKDVECE